MSEAVELTLSILLVDDDENKIKKIKDVIDKCTHNNIVVANDQISAQLCLLNEKFDLLILDMLLPLRSGEGDPQPDGGKNILEDLSMEENYKQPDSIIVLTEYDQLQIDIRESFAEIAAIKFDCSSTKWEESLRRVISRLRRSKNTQKRIVYCENKNFVYYNLIGLPNIEFRGLNDSRAVYLSAKNEQDKYALRDRDFLTQREIERLRSKYKNYFILNYYCFENYLFHPDNIEEISKNFDKQSYIDELVKQKREKLMTIVQDYKISRSTYTDLNDEGKIIMDKNPEDEIIKALESDELEVFYPYFDMAGKKDKGNKKSFDRTCLSQHNLEKHLLVRTNWFRAKMEALLEEIC